MVVLGAALAATAGCASRSVAEGRRVPVRPDGAAPLAAYTPAIRSGDFIFLSGQIGADPRRDNALPTDFREQTRQALTNVQGLLRGMGLEMADLVKCTVFLADMRDYEAMNEVYGGFFQGTDPPARSAVGVNGLPAGARVEIECLAAAR
jgi:2-iminobutanoate/2-iminopropanoate deaminase